MSFTGSSASGSDTETITPKKTKSDYSGMYLSPGKTGKKTTTYSLPLRGASSKSSSASPTKSTNTSKTSLSSNTSIETGLSNQQTNAPNGHSKQEQAQSTLVKLQTPKPTPSQYKSDTTTKTATVVPPKPVTLPTWSEDAQSLLTANINVLLSNATTVQERADANAYLAAQGAFQAHEPTNSQHGVKRQFDFISDDTAAEGLHPLKRARRVPKAVLTQSPANVFNLPSPIRIQYHPLPIKDRDDKWYAALFQRLYSQIGAFVDEYFVLHDLAQGDFQQPWALRWNPEFIFWAEQVAEDDPQVGSWDQLLRNSAERKWFLVAIIVKIIKVKIFDVDLWGANQQQKELLLAIERSMFMREGMSLIRPLEPQIDSYPGFQRTSLRAETVRSIIGAGAVTENFYDEIAKLNAQVFLMLEPLTSYLYRLEPEADKKIPDPANQYQSLHNIISSAAYLSLCVRMSPTIFFWVDVSPGTYYERDEHTSVDPVSYTRSKQAVVNAYNTARNEWVHAKKEIDFMVTELNFRGQSDTRKGVKAKQQQIAIQTQAPRQTAYEYRAMAKIGIWPSIKRFKPGSAEDEQREKNNPCDPIPLFQKNGSREYEISKAAVLCYYGKLERKDDGRVGLEEFVERKKKAYGFSGMPGLVVGKCPVVASVFGATALGILAYALRFQIEEKTGINFDFGDPVEFLNGIAGMIR